MTTLEILGIIGWMIVIGLSFILRNLLKKVEKYEEIVTTNNLYITKLSEAIQIAQIKIKELDIRGTFKSDDETGWFFKNLSYIQEILNEFNLSNEDRKKEKTSQKQ